MEREEREKDPRRDPSAGSGQVRRGYGDAEVAAAVKRWMVGA
jgi:hypothetical protein